MVKLTNQEIDDRLNLEGDIAAEPETDTEMQDAEFYFDENSVMVKTVQDRETLEQGTSYNEHMLDLNELAEKGLIGRGTKIDLSDMPEIDTLQAATEEQLMMITPESRKQITAIHLSNNTPVGWDDDYDYHNDQMMDESMDLQSFENLEKFETHFYLNDDLKTVKLPDSVTAIKFQHSKMESLDTSEQMMHCQLEMNHAETLNTRNIRQFHNAIEDGNLDLVKQYVINGVDVNHYDNDTYPALVRALEQTKSDKDSYAQIAKYLIKSGANVNKTEGYRSPLDIVTTSKLNKFSLAEDLLKAGAIISDSDFDNTMWNGDHPKTAALFIKYGYKVSTADLEKALDRDCSVEMVKTLVLANPEALKEIEASDKPCMARVSRDDVADFLMKQEVNLQAAAHNIRLEDKPAVLKNLIKHGVDFSDGKLLNSMLNQVRVWGYVGTGKIKSIETLLKNGVVPDESVSATIIKNYSPRWRDSSDDIERMKQLVCLLTPYTANALDAALRTNDCDLITKVAERTGKISNDYIKVIVDGLNDHTNLILDEDHRVKEVLYPEFSDNKNDYPQKKRMEALVKSGNKKIIEQIVSYAKSTGKQEVLDYVDAIIKQNPNKDKQRQLTESKIRVNKQKYRLDSKQGKTETVEENRPVRRTEMSAEAKQKLVSDKQNG